ncbi:hypothetical protein [Microlunatus speluncae]|uniref:hypothetical protein n=1 Tax=Microlunatus speluncae TaxID=2594267 RepID=UPI001266696D|nr:hypothetical protein [Microlunatus speluncae]
MSGPQQPGDWHLHEHAGPRPAEHDPGDPGTGVAWAQPTVEQRVPGRRPLTSKGRSWLLFLTAGCLVLIYMVIWTVYAAAHTDDRYVQLPPGQPSATSVNKMQYRVHSLVKTERINNPAEPDEPYIADAGTVYVVAEVEVLRVAENDVFYCQAELAVEGTRRIASGGGSIYLDGTKLPTSCPSDELKVGHPFRFLAIFVVPTEFADQIYGIAVQYTDYGAPFQVIRPPA